MQQEEKMLGLAPQFTITPSVAEALAQIETDLQVILAAPINASLLAALRENTRLLATHYSTKIEKNRLTLAQAREALTGVDIPGYERDIQDVCNYFKALEEVERLGQSDASTAPITEQDIQRIHGLLTTGRPKLTPYRRQENLFYDDQSGDVINLPDEHLDAQAVMRELVAWINTNLQSAALPLPIIAAIAHYQFTITHPYKIGNGRAARLLTLLILHKAGYGFHGIYNLEEYYVQHLPDYYDALTTNRNNKDDYYGGGYGATFTTFLSVFCEGMAHTFRALRTQLTEAANPI
jgi:Fic family protein